MPEYPTLTHARPYAAAGCARSATTESLLELRKLAQQQPLIETQPSIRALGDLPATDTSRPNSVFVGIGLASGQVLSRSLPVDALGMVLVGEQVRRAIRGHELVVLVADSHARCNGIPTLAVLKKAAEYADLLMRVQSCLAFQQMRVVFASDVHETVEFQEIYREIKRRAPVHEHDYYKREVADIEYFRRATGGLVKVGWTMGRRLNTCAKRDERAFDRRYCRWVGQRIPFVYCKAGRVFDDRKRKASPYLTLDPDRRLCLSPDEDVRGKVQCARREVSVSTFRGVGKHLSALTRTYGQLVAPVRGPLEQRVEQMLQGIFSGRGLC